jgi:hypothetical protein
MCGAIPPLSQYAFMACRSVKAQGQLYLLHLPLYFNYVGFISSDQIVKKKMVAYFKVLSKDFTGGMEEAS